MSRKRKDPLEKKERYSISIKKKLIEELRENYDVPSNIIEELVEEHLRKIKEKEE